LYLTKQVIMKVNLFTKRDPLTQARKHCLKKFLYYFKKGFKDPKYIDWERQYKLDAHLQFQQHLNYDNYKRLLQQKKFEEIALTAVKIESKTNLLFSFEKMALRDAVKTGEGAIAFANGLFEYIYGKNSLKERFENFVDVVNILPRKQTRVLTWPLVTVFGFIANPSEHIFLKPRVTKIAGEKYLFDFKYHSRPNWNTYNSLLEFAELIRKDTSAYKPADYIDLQSFIWVLGSEEYPD
jgi:hypothetical protein